MAAHCWEAPAKLSHPLLLAMVTTLLLLASAQALLMQWSQLLQTIKQNASRNCNQIEICCVAIITVRCSCGNA